jgi:ribokinase
MEVIAIGKPALNVYLPLQEFPQEGDLFNITSKVESVGNVAATSACILGKWGIPAHFSGVVGNDATAEHIRDTFKKYNVNSKFMETNFTSSTCTNYIILNAKTGVTTKVLFNDVNAQLTKYKYDFIPGFAILDGTDVAGSLALLNNNGASCKTLFYARRADKETVSLSKKCNHVVCTESFAVTLTHSELDGSAEGYVNMYQKIVDVCGNSNYIVILNNHKILYAVDGAVKMLPEMKINVTDSSSFDSVFVGALAVALIKGLSLDDGIKFANTAAAISLTKVGEETSIPTIEDVLDNSGMREKFGLKETVQQAPAEAQEVTPLQPNVHTENATASQSVSTPQVTPQVTQVQNDAQTPQVAPQSTPVTPTVSTPQESQAPELPKEVKTIDNATAMNAFDVSGFQNATPAPKPVETNIFDRPNDL